MDHVIPERKNYIAAKRHKIHKINEQYRICFKWIKEHSTDVEIIDYH
jgi:plasmid maintenance system killer protein